ncbi:MAG: hypothetical protein ACYTDV_15505 [Planctomycetota bacterium]
MPVIRSAREQAKQAVCLAHVKSLITGVHVYAADYDGNIPASIDVGFPFENNYVEEAVP